MRKILFIGDQWYGSDARSLANALSRKGHLVWRVDPNNFFPHGSSILNRAIRRLLRRINDKAFNDEILKTDSFIMPDTVIVYKGSEVKAKTLEVLKKRKRFLVQFYPDVSLYTHGANIPKCVPLYDLWLSTKSYGVTDVRSIAPNSTVHLIHHGYDPDIHRPIIPLEQDIAYNCDLSFIGTWDKEKERVLSFIRRKLDWVDLKIWGNYWEKCEDPILKAVIQYHPVNGDYYASTVQSSRVNLGLLSHRRFGASSGDLVTSRTFQIPACGGFLLHSGNEEVAKMFCREKEASFFDGDDDLLDKVEHFLKNDLERKAILGNGLTRARRDHSIDRRVDEIERIFKNMKEKG